MRYEWKCINEWIRSTGLFNVRFWNYSNLLPFWLRTLQPEFQDLITYIRSKWGVILNFRTSFISRECTLRNCWLYFIASKYKPTFLNVYWLRLQGVWCERSSGDMHFFIRNQYILLRFIENSRKLLGGMTLFIAS